MVSDISIHCAQWSYYWHTDPSPANQQWIDSVILTLWTTLDVTGTRGSSTSSSHLRRDLSSLTVITGHSHTAMYFWQDKTSRKTQTIYSMSQKKCRSNYFWNKFWNFFNCTDIPNPWPKHLWVLCNFYHASLHNIKFFRITILEKVFQKVFGIFSEIVRVALFGGTYCTVHTSGCVFHHKDKTKPFRESETGPTWPDLSWPDQI